MHDLAKASLVLIGLFMGGISAHASSGPLAKLEFPENCRVWKGVASFYRGSFAGAETASGRFENVRMTAAHRTLPFGTMLKVTDLDTNRSVMVVVNDRGPYIRGREIDLSVYAAERIGMRSTGVAPVRIERCE